MTNENDKGRISASWAALMVGVMGLLGAVLGGAIAGIASVSGTKMQLAENNKDTARKERVAAYTNFYYAANKVDYVFADLQECLKARRGPKNSCVEQVNLARAQRRSLTGSFEILRVYATDRALAEAAELKTLLESKQVPGEKPENGDIAVADETLSLERYRAARDRFTLAMCNDLSPQPRSECT
ncbi:hypothetical protein ACIBSW_17555 [Actinoplanes sp. NPDC049668]|uniref:hypothetical protein n=1 Tax=unclassified Actinoplanes TaxID=2626549 RepID=UPI0033BCDF48